ncbi:MAG: DEAD/DEAH box helicase [Deltaproteobacteria bacterium]|nr:DEAD/DEAH box helicase [Deltaproteobacteria bacterium]
MTYHRSTRTHLRWPQRNREDVDLDDLSHLDEDDGRETFAVQTASFAPQPSREVITKIVAEIRDFHRNLEDTLTRNGLGFLLDLPLRHFVSRFQTDYTVREAIRGEVKSKSRSTLHIELRPLFAQSAPSWLHGLAELEALADLRPFQEELSIEALRAVLDHSARNHPPSPSRYLGDLLFAVEGADLVADFAMYPRGSYGHTVRFPIEHLRIGAPKCCDLEVCRTRVAASKLLIWQLSMDSALSRRVTIETAVAPFERALPTLRELSVPPAEPLTFRIDYNLVEGAPTGFLVGALGPTGERIDGRSLLSRSLLEADTQPARMLASLGRPTASGAAGVLRALVAHPRVRMGEVGSPLRVESGELSTVLSSRGERVLLRPRVGTHTLNDGDVAVLTEADWIVHSPAEGVIRLASIGPTQHRLLSTLARFPMDAPRERTPEILAIARTLGSKVVARDLADRVEPARADIVVRIERVGRGIRARAFVRLAPWDLVLPPGAGDPDVVVPDSEGKWVAVLRDFVAETQQVRSRLEPVFPGHSQGEMVCEEPEEALDLIKRLRELGVSCEWPEHRPLTVSTAGARSLRVSVRDAKDWFGIEGGVDVDGRHTSLALLLDAVRMGRRYVSIDDTTFVEIDEELRSSLEEVAAVTFDAKSGQEITALALEPLTRLENEIGALELSPRFAAMRGRVENARNFHPELPPDLRAELRVYQREGYDWSMRLAKMGFGGCLADDMGLGKTVQALAVVLARKSEGATLVVAPMSVCSNWIRESARFTPGLEVARYGGPGRESVLEEITSGRKPELVLVASYDVVARDADRLAELELGTLILDEAHAIKNPTSKRAESVARLSAKFRLALTGTPLENHLFELWALFRALTPGLLGSAEQFRSKFALPIQRDNDEHARATLASAIRPFVLRRKKSEVAKELPSRTEIDVDVVLTPEHRSVYERSRLAIVAKLAGLDALRSEQQRFVVLAGLTELRQAACHPRLLEPTSKVRSAKLDRLVELVIDIVDEGQKVLVFSQFTRHLALVVEALRQENIRFEYLDGSKKAEEREASVDRFQNTGVPVFLISLRAGGLGLNLTAAENVIHLDPWWNPAVEDQATDRAHRIGQTRPVTVYRLVSRGTIEDSILALHAEKRELVAGVLDGSATAGRLSTDELIDLIRKGPTSTEDELDATLIEAKAEASRAASPSPSKALTTLEGTTLIEGIAERCIAELTTSGKLSPATLNRYARVIRRFAAEWPLELDPRSTPHAEWDRQIASYEERAGEGTIPMSDRKVARTSVWYLEDFARRPHEA